jgi:uncharacterized protein
MLKPNMPSPNDAEGTYIPDGLTGVIDAHVHVFPRSIFSAIRRWFDQHAWHIRYGLGTTQIFEFLLTRGISHIIALQYAHKPGIAGQLNRYMVDKCKDFKGLVTGLATVYPGEDHADRILQEAFDAGLGGVKLHAHVQCFEMNADYMNPIYACCRSHQKPMLMHVGREPKSDAYRCDPYEICSAEKLERVLKEFPGLKVCVPHLGFDEIREYQQLIEKYDTLWLDTTMVLTEYFHLKDRIALDRYRADRILYGSDFPSIPYAWDRELKVLRDLPIPEETIQKIAAKNAADLFQVKVPGAPSSCTPEHMSKR